LTWLKLITSGGSQVDGSLCDEWSTCLSENAIEPEVPTSVVRTVFTDTTFVDLPTDHAHTHGKSAGLRSASSLFIDNCARYLGKKLIYYQGSKSDVRNGREYSRTLHWIKDHGVEPRKYNPGPDDMVALVDVDYYIDMPSFMANNFRPIFLYSFQPSSVSRSTGEYKYTFNQNGTVTYIVSGGATYMHQVWNYDGDSVIVKKYKNFGCTKILSEVSCFSLERRQVDDDHQIILLAPMAKYVGLAAWIADAVLDGRELSRLNPVVGKFTRLTTNDHDGMRVHTGLASEFVSCVVEARHDAELGSIARVGSIDLPLAVVRKYVVDEISSPAILREFHLSMLNHKLNLVSTSVPRVRRYQIVKDLSAYNPDAKPSLVPFMNPIVDGAFAPDMCDANDERSIKTRINDVRDNTQLSKFLIDIVDEFVELFVDGNTMSLTPVELDEVYERQNSPQQRRILAESDNFEKQDRLVKSFMKREAYANVTDPRNISTINGADKRDYSTYMYALGDYIKRFEWYAFGKTPLEIASRVADIATASKIGITETDFSRMDGRVGEVLRHLEKTLIMKLFGKRFHNELLELMRGQTNLRGVTRHGIKYDSGLSRLSGSPETSVFNTIANAFVAFLTFRKTKVQNRYVNKFEAWNRLGIYGGDDGLTADVDDGLYATAAAMVGQHLTSETKHRGASGVKFLARLYGPEVWFGDMNSTCDIPRTLSKFHTTVALPKSVSDEEKLVDKAYALSLTDSNTPIVGPYVTRVMSKRPPNFKFRNYGRKWQFEQDVSKQYPNEYSDWMMDYAQKALPEFAFGQFNDWINGCVELRDLMQAPKFQPPVEPMAAKSDITIVDGDLVDMPVNAGTDVVKSPAPVAEVKPPRKPSRPRKKKADRKINQNR